MPSVWRSGSPASIDDGTFGSDGARAVAVTTIGFTAPEVICGVALMIWSNSESIWPPIRSLSAWESPR